jgi:hypothetical protein
LLVLKVAGGQPPSVFFNYINYNIYIASAMPKTKKPANRLFIGAEKIGQNKTILPLPMPEAITFRKGCIFRQNAPQ